MRMPTGELESLGPHDPAEWWRSIPTGPGRCCATISKAAAFLKGFNANIEEIAAMYQTFFSKLAKSRHYHAEPAEKRNAISTQMMAELQTALDEIERSHARVGILTGAGKAFCAGMDLDMLAAIAKQISGGKQEDSRRIAKLFRRIWSFPRPLIAAVTGAAFAGGCGVATLCDFTLAVPEAKFGVHGSEDRFPAGDSFPCF